MTQIFKKIWKELSEEAYSDMQYSQKRQTRLLATLLLSIIPVSLVVTIFPGLIFYGNTIEIIVFLIVLVSAFLLVLGYIISSSLDRLYIILSIIGISSFIIFVASVIDVNLLPFLVVPLLLCAIFLSAKTTLAIMGIDLVGILVVPTYVLGEGMDIKVFWGFNFILVTSFLLLVVIRHRRKLELNHQLAVSESEKHFLSLADTATDAIVTIDKDGKVISINKSTTEIFHYQLHEIAGKHISVLVPSIPKDFPKETSFRKDDQSIDILHKTFEVNAISKGNGAIPVDITFAPWQTQEGLFFTSILRDISHRKQIELELRRERDLAKQYLDIAGVMILIRDSKGTIKSINKKGCELIGYKPHEILGKNWIRDFVTEEEQQNVAHILDELSKGNLSQFQNYQSKIKTKTGHLKTIYWNNAVMKDNKGKIRSIISSGEDITEREHMIEDLRQRNQELEKLNKAMIGRELQMIKLKKKLKSILGETSL